MNMSLEELMNIEIDVASQKSASLRETPGIVSVITAKDITDAGARDLMDVLRLVPGIEFACDAENTIGIGVRGNYGIEGKVLVIIDGQQMNETNYGTFIFGQNINVENIKKIEIIRGPGSAKYGGMAELAVINIVTKNGKDLDGIEVFANYGYADGATLRTNATVNAGKKLENGLDISLSASYSQGNRSNLTEMAEDSTITNWADSSGIQSMAVNLGVNYKNLDFRFIYQMLQLNYLNFSEADYLINGGLYSSLSYKWKINDKLTITPSVSWKQQDPWTYKGNLTEFYTQYYVMKNSRTKGNITANYSFNDNINFSIGAEAYHDVSKKDEDTNPYTFSNGKFSIAYDNIAVYTELFIKTKYVNVIGGARFDNHSLYGSSFVPRFCLTKAFNKLHFKLLYSEAFKAPVFWNIEFNPDIKPEKTKVIEAEIGYQFNENNAARINIFNIDIEDPIVYYYISDLDQGYQNYSRTGTQGFELEYRVTWKWGYLNAGYSYYQANDNQVKAYQVETDKNLMRAFPASKFTAYSTLKVNDKISFSPTIIYNSAKYSYQYLDPDWNTYGQVKTDAHTTINLLANFRNIFKGFSASVGVYNIIGKTQYLVCANDNAFYRTPMHGQEFILKLSYAINKKSQ